MRWTWVTPISVLQADVNRRAREIPIAVGAAMGLMAVQIQGYMTGNAPWQDQSGAARAGLAAEYVGGGMLHAINAYGTVDYQLFLELGTRFMAPRPIIMPALQAHYGAVMAMLQSIAGG